MLCALYTIKKKYRDKKIYIWDINRNSMILFARAAFRRIDITGFVTFQDSYVGKTYVNRQIISLEQAKCDKDCVILVSDELLETTRERLPKDRIIYWSRALEINDDLKTEKIIVYGMGDASKQLCRVLHNGRISPQYFCVTKRTTENEWNGSKIIEAYELDSYNNYSVIISVQKPEYRLEILDTLVDFCGKVYLDIDFILNDLYMTNIIQDLDLAVRQKREIYLYSRRNKVAELIKDVLYAYGIQFSGYVYDREDLELNIKSIYDLSYECTENKLIIINEGFPENMIKARENVECAGFSLEKRNYTSIWRYTEADEFLLSRLKSYHDPLTGVSMLYKGGKPGWKVYGTESDGCIKIMVLGGSTSSEIFYSENWVSKLFYKLKKEGIPIVIYNGAHPGDDIVTELLRLLRDAHVLMPDFVISMSGVNNTEEKKSVNQFNETRLIEWVRKFSSKKEYCSGISSNESLYSFWYRNQKLLRIISEFYGAAFLGFLQPMNMAMQNMTLFEKSYFDMEVHHIGCKAFAQFSSENEEYINLLHLFDHQEEMYIDPCHYTETAHTIIADQVFQVLLSLIKSL